MYEKFTDRARRKVVEVREVATRLGDSRICSEHLLVALASEPEGVAGRVLTDRGLTDEVLLGSLKSEKPPKQVQLEPPTQYSFNIKLIMESIAWEEAQMLGHNFIGTEHLLLAIVGYPDCEAAKLLLRLGHDLLDIRQDVLNDSGLQPRVAGM